ncbi:MAG: class I SAM-dependent methyltransferase [Jatrophihabitantaceae bacterium]
MPIMPVGERVFCRTTAWGVFARRAVPWALSRQALNGDVLEIGGGSGAMAVGMLTRFPSMRLVVVDLDPAMVAATTRRLGPFGARASVRIGDATALPFTDESFDTVVSFLMLHHVGAWESAVAEVGRVLRPGGRFLGYDLPDSAISRTIHHADGIHDMRSITEPTFRAALAHAGVTDVRFNHGRLGLTLRWVATKTI